MIGQQDLYNRVGRAPFEDAHPVDKPSRIGLAPPIEDLQQSPKSTFWTALPICAMCYENSAYRPALAR